MKFCQKKILKMLMVFNFLPCVSYAADCINVFCDSETGDVVCASAMPSNPTLFIKDEIAENVKNMREFGYDDSKRLIERYRHFVKSGQTVLELGPYYNPLGPLFGEHIHWLVWEYDTTAANQIASDLQKPERTVFRVDLNTLDKRGWMSFQEQSTRYLDAKHSLGAAVFSSVLNYVDYRVVLREVVPMIEDQGLLIIANSEIAKGIKFNANSRAVPTLGVVEYLMNTFGNQIEFLPGSEIQSRSGLSPSSISLAIKVHKQMPSHREDQYTAAISMYLEHCFLQESDDRALRDPLSSWLIRERSDEKNRILLDRWSKRKAQLIEDFKSERRQLISLVRKAEPAKDDDDNSSLELEVLKKIAGRIENLKYRIKDLDKYEIMPEREILLKALNILDIPERNRMLDRELDRLYRSLG